MGLVVIGMPYAFSHFGIPLAVATLLVLSFLGYFSSMLMLKTRELTLPRTESLYEIGYLHFGRPSIFAVTLANLITVYLPMIAYYIACGDVLSVLTR